MDNIRATIDYVIGLEASDYQDWVNEVWEDRDFSLELLEESMLDPEIHHPYKTAVLAKRELEIMEPRVPVYLTVDQLTALVS